MSLCNVLEHILVIVKNEGGHVRQNAFPIISCRSERELYLANKKHGNKSETMLYLIRYAFNTAFNI